MSAKSESGFTLIEILVVVAIIGVLMVVLLPRVTNIRDRSNSTACQVNLQHQYQEIELYRQRFNHLPTASGVKFLGELWKSGMIEHDVKETKLFMCPGDQDLLQKQNGDHVGRDAVFEALNDYETLTSEYMSYACRNMKECKLDFSKPASQLLVSDDDEDAPNHKFNVNCLYLDGSVDSVDIKEFPDEIIIIGPESPVEKFRVLSNN